MTAVGRVEGWTKDPRLLVREGLVVPSLTVIVAHLSAPQGSKIFGGLNGS